MLLPDLKPLKTDLKKLKEVPDVFFNRLENANAFDNNLFPDWLSDEEGNWLVFKEGTELRNRFKAIYEKYKSITDISEREKIISAYLDSNKVIELCNNIQGLKYIELTQLNLNIQQEIDNAFLYLYNSALKHPGFEEFVNDNIKSALKKFTDENEIEVCPFCGLEMMLQIEDQARIPLDHWLNKNRFPFAAINFDNLIPIGKDCNSNGVKGEKNVLKDASQTTRAKSYYPYAVNKGVTISIVCLKEPNIENIHGEWKFSISQTEESEKLSFDSWNYIFNINNRYNSYFTDYIILNWKKRYANFIKSDEDILGVHAEDISQFKENLKQWKKSFNIRTTHGAILYKNFIDYLLKGASDSLLFGIVESFKSQSRAGVI